MKVLSNVEFEKLTEEKSPRIKSLAKARCDRNPEGFLTTAELDEIIKICKYSGDEPSTRWLQALKILSNNGQLHRSRTGTNTWEDHSNLVSALRRKGEISFGLFDHIILKETGKRGTVVDYNIDDKKYLVTLDPFELKWFEKKDLEKTAKLFDQE